MTPPMSLLVLAGVLGLAIGSFLNVVIYRLPLGQSRVSPPSTCPSCRTRLRWVDNIPVLSWILLGGKCHHCRAAISIQDPTVERVTGALFVLVTWLTPAGPLLAARLILVLILVQADVSKKVVEFFEASL